jgi:hypothetical protein
MLQNGGFYEQMFAYRAPRIHTSLRRQPRRASLAVAAVAAFWLAGVVYPAAQFEKMVSTTFDGWSQKADGSYELVFGYMNRNSSEIEVPLGPANQVEPGPVDRGQPTNFLPGRQRAAFRIAVPKEFKGKFVWTLSYGGQTQVATASLDQNYSLDVGDPEPPGIKPGPDRTIPLSGTASLAPVVSAPPPPAPSSNPDVVVRQSRGARITVWYSKFRGPGIVTFSGGEAPAAANPGPTGRDFPAGVYRVACPNPPAADCGAVSAQFSAPGTYWLRVVAAERSASNAIVKVVVTP